MSDVPYSNGADANVNQTALNQGARLGNGNGTNTPKGPEIAVIIVTISLFALAMFVTFYCRALQMRRKIDMINQDRERKAQATVEGDAIELSGGNTADTTAGNTTKNTAENDITDFRPAGSEVGFFAPGEARSDRTSRTDLESGLVKKPLWHYIHWKDPCNSPKPRVKPRPAPEGTR